MATSSKTVKIYVHSTSSWFPARPYQSNAFFDFQEKKYTKHHYCSDSSLIGRVAANAFIVDQNDGSKSHFPSQDEIEFSVIRDERYVYLANNKGEFHLITDDVDTVGADYLKDLKEVDLTDFKNVSGIDLSRELEYRPDNSGNDWFEKTFGFNERKWKAESDVDNKPGIADSKSSFTRLTKETLKRRPALTVWFPKFMSPPRKLLTGVFGTPTLKELRTFALSQGYPNKVLSKIKNVVVGDVFNTHSDPKYKGALFQVASQFNCLEFPTHTVVPENGITGYVYDRTQGPACSIPTGGATFYRNYLVPVKNGVVTDAPVKTVGQTADNQINCLVDVLAKLEAVYGEQFVVVRNGYTFSTDETLTRLSKILNTMSPSDLANLMDNLRIGTQFGVGVLLNKDRYVISQERLQCVSQAFCSAISVSYSRLSPEKWETFAKAVLNASYEATLWSAVINKNIGGSNKVVLTCVGGGVFGNDLEWIAEAICKAFLATKNYGLDIEIGHYNESTQREFIGHFDKAKKTYGL